MGNFNVNVDDIDMLEMINKFNWVLPENLQKIDGRPPLYSQNRQELCEALPYFRSYQGKVVSSELFLHIMKTLLRKDVAIYIGGNYVSKERTMGYLLDGCPSPRDVFEDSGKVIISHAGGGSRMIRAGLGGGPPELTLVKSQKREGYLVQGLINCQLNNLPIVLLVQIAHAMITLQAGKKFSGMPWIQSYDSVGYAVLGFYLVTHSWPEKEYRRDQPHKYCIRFKCKHSPFHFEEKKLKASVSSGFRRKGSVVDGGHESVVSIYRTTIDEGRSNSNWARAPRETSPAMSDRESQSPSDGAENDDEEEELDDDELNDDELNEYEDSVTSTSDGQPESDDGIMDWEATDQIRDDSPDEVNPEDVDSIEYRCDTCEELSLKIYQGPWMCLNEHCDKFFQRNGARPTANELRYVPWFMSHQDWLELEKRVPSQLKPLTLQKLSDHQLEFAAHQESKTGFHCNSCGRLSIRVFWRALICSNEHCQFRVDFAVSSPLNLSHLPSGYGKRRNTTCDINSLHAIQSFKIPRYSVRLYRFLHDAGDVIHAIPNDDLSRSGADNLFHQILNDVDPISFKRNKIKSHKSLTAGNRTSIVRKRNPGRSTRSLSQLLLLREFVVAFNNYADLGKDLTFELLPEDFNELLSCFYLAGSGMNCGRSLSLGSAALMSFKRIPMQPLDNDTRPSNPPVLELMVGHGDIVLQSGSKLQDKYLHAVKTDGLRICKLPSVPFYHCFPLVLITYRAAQAATARCINTDMMR
ncbi:hypothetical protein PSTT_13455 [Puccinia striiformis]|uniref:Alpha-ketoglutarate-dependent dioxygenase AlkB-like domain-containing protein n=1 Tax=Puccinia striiformis TaxID=27350 RepID=A0A2S4URV0_9BASI|nr:hypothetical protein PSTT_13455 [Puccinia striiformis]